MSRRKGAANPAWKGGLYTNDRTFKASRTITRVFNLERKGENCCRACGSSESVNAHHAIPRSIGTYESNRDLRNLLPLCATCHSRWHRGARLVTREMFTQDEWSYLCSVELTGRETLPWLEDHYPPAAQLEIEVA